MVILLKYDISHLQEGGSDMNANSNAQAVVESYRVLVGTSRQKAAEGSVNS